MRNLDPLKESFDGIRDGVALIRLKRVWALETVRSIFQMSLLSHGPQERCLKGLAFNLRFSLSPAFRVDQMKFSFPLLPPLC